MCGLRTFHCKRQGWVQAFSHILGSIYLCSPAASCQLQSQLTATGRAARGAWGVWEQGSLCHAPARGRDAAAADLSSCATTGALPHDAADCRGTPCYSSHSKLIPAIKQHWINLGTWAFAFFLTGFVFCSTSDGRNIACKVVNNNRRKTNLF